MIYTNNHDNFFKVVEKNKLTAIMTFSFNRYAITAAAKNSGLQLKQETETIIADFEKFIVNHRDQKSVKMWVLGDVSDDGFAQTTESESNGALNGQIGILLENLFVTLQRLDPIHRRFGVGVKTPNARSSIVVQLSNQLNWDIWQYCWILHVGENIAENIVGFGGVVNGSDVPCIVQPAASAWDPYELAENWGGQAGNLTAFISNISDLANPRDLQSHIVQEWADQWWRGIDPDCGSNRPYFHTPDCGELTVANVYAAVTSLRYEYTEHQGLAEQVDMYGRHCLNVRDAFNAYIRVLNEHADMWGGTKTELQVDNPYCALLWVPFVFNLDLFSNEFSQRWLFGIYLPIAVLLFLNCALWWRWKKKTKTQYDNERRAIKNVVQKKKKPKKGKKKTEENKPLLSGEGDDDAAAGGKKKKSKKGEEDTLTTPQVFLDGCSIGFVLTGSKKLFQSGLLNQAPAKEIPVNVKSDNDDEKADNTNEERESLESFLSFMLHEHLYTQVRNVDTMLDHEMNVVQSLVDFKTIKIVDTEHPEEIDRSFTSFADSQSIMDAVDKEEENFHKNAAAEAAGITRIKSVSDDEDAAKSLEVLDMRTRVYLASLDNVHSRMLEGYHCWVDKQKKNRGLFGGKKINKISVDPYAELVLFRLLTCICEHVIHCPERLAQVYHAIVEKKTEEDDVFVISLDMLLGGLEKVAAGEMNFDDLNDCGIKRAPTKSLTKTWTESQSYGVYLDLLRNYNGILFVKGWVFMLSLMASYLPTGELPAADYLRTSAFIDAGAFGLCELSLWFFDVFQSRSWFSNISGVVAAGGMIVYLVLQDTIINVISKDKDKQNTFIVPGLVIYFLLRLFMTVFITPQSLIRVLLCRGTNMYESHMMGSTGKAPKKVLVTRASWLEAFLFWGFIMISTFMLEWSFVVPIIANLGLGVCSNQCRSATLVWNASTLCSGCQFALVLMYLLVTMTIMIDSPMIFYLAVSMWGYFKGQKRAVQNVYASDQMTVDLRADGRERRNLEAVFGEWSNSAVWVWCDLVNSLHERDLICKTDLIKLSTPGKKYDFSEISTEGRERLVFFLQTVASMAKNLNKRQRFLKSAKEKCGDEFDFMTNSVSEYRPPDGLSKAGLDSSGSALDSARDGPGPKESKDGANPEKKKKKKKQRKLRIRVKNRYQPAERDDEDLEILYDPAKRAANVAAHGMAINATTYNNDIAGMASGGGKLSREDLNDLSDQKEYKKEHSHSALSRLDYASTGSKPRAKITMGKTVGNSVLASELLLNETQRQEKFFRAIPRLSHIITCYEETIMLSSNYLQKRQAGKTNIEHLIDMGEHLTEWQIFCERFVERHPCAMGRNLVNEFLSLGLGETGEEKGAPGYAGPQVEDTPGDEPAVSFFDNEPNQKDDYRETAHLKRDEALWKEWKVEMTNWKRFREEERRERNSEQANLVLMKQDVEAIKNVMLNVAPDKHKQLFGVSSAEKKSVASSAVAKMQKALEMDVRLWASMRTQTVIRTIRGALSYQDSLSKRLERFQSKSADDDLKVEDLTELLISHQTYGIYPGPGSNSAVVDGWKQRRDDIEYVMKKYQQYPMLLVYDYKAPPAHSQRRAALAPAQADISQDKRERDFDFHWRNVCKPFWEADEEEMKEFWDNKARKYKLGEWPMHPKMLQHATCVKKMVDGRLKLVAVLPRIYPLRLGKGENATQGKAGNQLLALRNVTGHIIQVSDANMDSWIGEGYKLPFVTRQFIDGNILSSDPVDFVNIGKSGDRKKTNYRIIGFREFIFTGSQGATGQAMASSEFTFGTIFQRVLADPLNVRMHYGHPDFFDAFWVLNRGSLSKASAKLNLSEDIFAGFNATNRGEQITHVDILEWQKGRETVFTAASGFIQKVSSGAVAMIRTRDVMHLQTGMSFSRKLSLYFGGVGSYIYQLCIDYSIVLYVTFFFVATVSNITLTQIGATGSSLGAEWLVSFGFVATLPLLTELMLEYGWASGLLTTARWLIPASIFWLFQNKMISETLKTSFRTGKAAYINTGRPNPFDHYSLQSAYLFYANTHYHPALEILLYYWMYRCFVTSAGGATPMFLVLTTVTTWLLAPVMFCPQIGSSQLLRKDMTKCFSFVSSVHTGEGNESDSLDFIWRTMERESQALDSLRTRLVAFVFTVIKATILIAIFPATTIDWALIMFSLLGYNAMLTMIWSLTNFTNAIRGLWILFPIVYFMIVPVLLGQYQVWGPETILGTMVFMAIVRVLHELALILVTIIVKFLLGLFGCCGCCLGLRDKYVSLVDQLFFISLEYHLKLYCALFVICLQFAFRAVVVVVLGVWDCVFPTQSVRDTKIKRAQPFVEEC